MAINSHSIIEKEGANLLFLWKNFLDVIHLNFPQIGT